MQNFGQCWISILPFALLAEPKNQQYYSVIIIFFSVFSYIVWSSGRLMSTNSSKTITSLRASTSCILFFLDVLNIDEAFIPN